MQKKLYTDSSIETFLTVARDWKVKADYLSDLFLSDDQMKPRGVKMTECGHWLVFDPAFDAVPAPPSAAAETAPQYHLTRSNFCRQRLCPVCQWRRSRMIFAHLTDVWEQLRSDGYDVLHVVLTVRNVPGDQLRDEITKMYNSFSFMAKNELLSGWKGSLRFLEVSYNMESKLYHPHLHVLIAVKPSYFKSRYYVSRELLTFLWRAALHVDYDPMCYITKCDPAAILEVSKYCVKPFDFAHVDPAETLGIYRTFDVVLHNRRLIQSYGVIRKTIRDCKLSDTLDDEDDPDYSVEALQDQIGETFHRMRYAYNRDARRYELC